MNTQLKENINFEEIPFFELAVHFINQGSCPTGTKRNLEFIQDKLFGKFVDLEDPNTLRNLSEPNASRTIFETFKLAINEL